MNTDIENLFKDKVLGHPAGLFILFFLLGAFISNFLVELVSLKKPRFSHTIPMLIEIGILSFIGFAD